MAAKKRCQFQAETDSQCNQAALRIVGQCPHCRVQFCGSVWLILFYMNSTLNPIVPFILPLASPPRAPQLHKLGGLQATGIRA